mgnify:CR=1 FL=1
MVCGGPFGGALARGGGGGGGAATEAVASPRGKASSGLIAPKAEEDKAERTTFTGTDRSREGDSEVITLRQNTQDRSSRIFRATFDADLIWEL